MTKPFSSVLLLAVLAAGCSNVEASPEAEPKRVAATTVGAAEATVVRTFSGKVRARSRALLSFEVSGRVEKVHYDVGDTFEAGAELARLEQQVPRLNVARAKAQLKEAEATQAQAQREFHRKQQLLPTQATTQASYDLALSQLETSSSRVEVAKAALQLASEELADTVLNAPYAGVLSERLIEPSQNVAAGSPALRIQGQGELEVVVDVPETLVTALSVGSEQRVQLTAFGDEPYQATITEISADAEPGGIYPVYLTLSAPPAGLRSGASAEVALGVGASAPDELTIPHTAFLPSGDNRVTVFVLEAEAEEPADQSEAPPLYVVKKQEVPLVRLAQDHAVIGGGLTKDAVIVTRGLAFLREGQQVTRLTEGPERYGH